MRILEGETYYCTKGVFTGGCLVKVMELRKEVKSVRVLIVDKLGNNNIDSYSGYANRLFYVNPDWLKPPQEGGTCDPNQAFRIRRNLS